MARKHKNKKAAKLREVLPSLDLGNIYLGVSWNAWAIHGPKDSRSLFAFGRDPNVAREIAKWFNRWADWYEANEKD